MNNFPGQQFDMGKGIPGNYFDQSSYYISGNSEIRRIENMHPTYARNAMKRYRQRFPQYVHHLNHTHLGRALRLKYLRSYVRLRG